MIQLSLLCVMCIYNLMGQLDFVCMVIFSWNTVKYLASVHHLSLVFWPQFAKCREVYINNWTSTLQFFDYYFHSWWILSIFVVENWTHCTIYSDQISTILIVTPGIVILPFLMIQHISVIFPHLHMSFLNCSAMFDNKILRFNIDFILLKTR